MCACTSSIRQPLNMYQVCPLSKRFHCVWISLVLTVSVCVWTNSRSKLNLFLTLFNFQAVYNWQFVHCLNLWSQVLSQLSHPSLRPLIYPLVQIVLGTLNVQPSAKYYPLRLHLVRLLLQLSSSTNTYIPIATYLVEVREMYGKGS